MSKIKTILVSFFCLILSMGIAAADSANWDAAKQAQMNVNRNSDAGDGNGGERYNRRDGWRDTVDGEDGGWDRDPGNSKDHNQAG